MGQVKAFSIENSRRRLKEATERLDAVSRSIADLVDEYWKPEDETKDVVAIMAKAVDEVPVYLLASALAEEGLALVEQVRWEAKILDIEVNRFSSAEISELAETAATLKSWATTQVGKFEQFRDQSNRLVQHAMRFGEIAESAKQLSNQLANSRKK